MNYRFVKITTYYKVFLDDFYSRHPDTAPLSYDDHLALLMSECFGWADFFKHHHKALGNEAFEIIANDPLLQSKWAGEHGTKSSGWNLIVEQLKELKPDVIFLQDSISLGGAHLAELKKEVPSIRKIIGWCCSPYNAETLSNFRYFDFAFGCSPLFVNNLTDAGVKTYQFNHAFEARLLDKLPAITPDTDIMFLGSFIAAADFHDERIKLIDSLLRTTLDIKVYASLTRLPWYTLMLRKFGYYISSLLIKSGLKDVVSSVEALRKSAQLHAAPRNTVYPDSFYKKIINKQYFGLEMLKLLSRGRTGLNNHGGVAGDFAANSRMYEVTGLGRCLLTDNKKNIGELFVPDEEIVVYSSVEECVEKATWLSRNPDRAKEIGRKAQQRILKEHTFAHRVHYLDTIIRKELENK